MKVDVIISYCHVKVKCKVKVGSYQEILYLLFTGSTGSYRSLLVLRVSSFLFVLLLRLDLLNPNSKYLVHKAAYSFTSFSLFMLEIRLVSYMPRDSIVKWKHFRGMKTTCGILIGHMSAIYVGQIARAITSCNSTCITSCNSTWVKRVEIIFIEFIQKSQKCCFRYIPCYNFERFAHRI